MGDVEKMPQMDAGRPVPPQGQKSAPVPQRAAESRQPAQQAGGASASGQMGVTQFTDWASI